MAGWKRINTAEWESVNVAERAQPEELLSLPAWVDARPVSRWRKGWLKHVAFFVGNAPRFRLVITARGDVDPRQNIWWEVNTGLASGKTNKIALPAMTEGDVFTEDIDLPMLQSSGEYTLELRRKPGEVGDPLYTFVSVTKERRAITLLLTAPLAIIALGSSAIAIILFFTRSTAC